MQNQISKFEPDIISILLYKTCGTELDHPLSPNSASHRHGNVSKPCHSMTDRQREQQSEQHPTVRSPAIYRASGRGTDGRDVSGRLFQSFYQCHSI